MSAAVVASWSERRTPSDIPYADVVAVITQTCSLGTELVGRYLATSEGALPQEAKQLADLGKLTMEHGFALTDITKTFLTWRDVTVRVLIEERKRLDVDRSVLAEATSVAQFMGDASLVRMVKRFDEERCELQERLLLDRLAHAMALPARHQRPVMVLFLDLDDFKAVNDRFGHTAGDGVLVAVAERLTALVRPSDTVARLGGDEFVILCEDLDGGEPELTAQTARIKDAVGAVSAPEHDLAVSVSIGVAIAHAGTDPAHILTQADLAMYAANNRPHVSGPSRIFAATRNPAN